MVACKYHREFGAPATRVSWQLHKEDPAMNTLKEFRGHLWGWMTNPDGEDFCPTCFHQVYLKRIPAEGRSQVKDDSNPTKDYAETRKARDGWLVMCDNMKCTAVVFVPFTN